MTGASLPESMIFAISAELLAVRLHADEHGPDAERFCFLNDGGCHQRKQNTALFQNDQERSCVSPPMVSSTTSMLRADIFESLLRVIDRLVHAEFTQ